MDVQLGADLRKIGPARKLRAPAAARAQRAEAAGPLLILCLAAVLLRALACALSPNVVWADETFQAAEQALRLLTGRGQIPWEYQVGARSWILPAIALGPMALGRAVSHDPRVPYALIAGVMIALSAVNVWSAYVLGQAKGRWHGLFAAGLAAGWCELVYYSPHLLPDTLSGALLLAGLAVASRPERPRSLFWAGVLLGACLAVRVQLAPAVGLAALLACRTAFRARAPQLAAGFVLPLAALAALDAATWGAPLRSLWVYVRTNLGGVASAFGVAPPLAYLGTEKQAWGWAAPLVVATAVLGAKRAPGLAATAATVALTFTLVGHKEPRFIYPALLLLFAVCGIGAAELAQDLSGRLRDERARRLVGPALALIWAAGSLAAGFGPGMAAAWKNETDVLQALDAINADPQSCGVGLDSPQWALVGLSRLRDDLQLYDAQSAPGAAYDYVLRLPGPRRPRESYLAQGFAPAGCFGAQGICLLRRPGGCAAGYPPLRALTPQKVRTPLARLGYQVY